MSVIGTLQLRDFDQGVVTTLGAEQVSYDVDGDARLMNVVDVSGVTTSFSDWDEKVPVYFSAPEDVYQQFKLPNFSIRRNDLSVAFDRKPWWGVAARGPADGASEVLRGGVRGYDSYTTQWRGCPFDISYDIQIFARRQPTALKMLNHTLRNMRPPWFSLIVVDSKSEIRNYDAGDINISTSSELADMSDRTLGFTISFTVRGELDLVDDSTFNAALDFDTNYQNYDPQ